MEWDRDDFNPESRNSQIFAYSTRMSIGRDFRNRSVELHRWPTLIFDVSLKFGWHVLLWWYWDDTDDRWIKIMRSPFV